MIKRAFVIACLCLTASSVIAKIAISRAPSMKQTKLWMTTYEASDFWQTDSRGNIRAWMPKYFSLITGDMSWVNWSASRINGQLTEARGYNSGFRVLAYDLWCRQAADTSWFKTWATSRGYDADTLFVRVASGQTTVVRADADKTIDFGRWVTTTGPNILTMPGYNDAQTRFVFDFRVPIVGDALWSKSKEAMDTVAYDGRMYDEECVVKQTGMNYSGMRPLQLPFLNTTTAYWQTGSPRTSLTKNWGSGLTDAQIKDSTYRARDGWMFRLGDSMEVNGKIYAPNFAGTGYTYDRIADWTNEAKHDADLAHNIILGEYCGFNPSSAGEVDNAMSAVRLCYDARNMGINIFVGWIRMGQYDHAVGYDVARMNGLGLMMDCDFDGTSSFFFAPTKKNGQVYFQTRDDNDQNTVNGYTEQDTTVLFDYAWTYYWGVDPNTRDSVTYSGCRVFQKNRPGTSTPLTIVMRNIPGGAGTTSIALPGGYTWRELISDPATGRTASTRAHWSTSTSSGSISVLDNTTRIFSSDTVMSANGIFTPITPEIRVKSAGRYLETAAGTPVFLNGDTPWSLFAQLTTAQAHTYFTDRAGRSFNATIANLIERWYADHAPNNIYNEPPFTGAAFTTPNESYFARCDTMLRCADSLGIYVFLDPLYLGWGCTSSGGTGYSGWCAEIKAASTGDLQSWGTYVGNRYKDFTNIVWMPGGDADPRVASLGSKYDAFVAALKTADNVYTDRVITSHGSSTVNPVSGQFGDWPITLDGIYTWSTSSIVSLAQSAYSAGKPFVGIEFNYEDGYNMVDRTMLRSQSYWSVLSGGCGVFFGNSPIWYFTSQPGINESTGVGDIVLPNYNAAWTTRLNTNGANDMTRLYAVMTAVNWWTLTPDLTILTSGRYSTGHTGEGDYTAAVAKASDGSSIVAYFPTSRDITINETSLTASEIRARWYNPATGAYTDINHHAKTTAFSQTSPSGDAVLILDAYNTPTKVVRLRKRGT